MSEQITEDRVRELLVERFLQWQIPKSFNPDGGISFTRPSELYPHMQNADENHWPVGTNLLDAEQAGELIDFLFADINNFKPEWSLLKATQESLLEHMREVRELRDRVREWQPIETAPNHGAGLLLFDNGHIEDASFHEIDGDWLYNLFDGETLIHKPTHWMPLPEEPTHD